PAAQHGMAADVEILLDYDHRGAMVARRHRCGKARGARADDHDVRQEIPFHRRYAGRGGPLRLRDPHHAARRRAVKGAASARRAVLSCPPPAGARIMEAETEPADPRAEIDRLE